MQFLLILALSALPSSLSLALHPRQSTLPILPPPGALTQADVAPNCARWDLIGSPGPIRCSDIIALHPDVTYSELILWNPSVGPNCDNTWDSYWFCSAISGPFVPLPAHTAAGVPLDPAPGVPQGADTASPICDRWDAIITGASCQTYMSRYPGLTVSDLQAWNPAIIVGANACFLMIYFDLCTSVVGHVFETPLAISAPAM